MTNEELTMSNEEAREILSTLNIAIGTDVTPMLLKNQILKATSVAIEVLGQQPCEDCISRERLLARIDEERKHLLDLKMDGAEHIIVHHARRIIEDMPSVTPQPKMGKWIKEGEWSEGFGMGETYGWIYECSECGKQVKGNYCGCNYNYCPYCGSDNRDLESLGKSFADGYEDGLEEK